MKTSTVSSADLKVGDIRLDCGPYVNDSFAIKKLLKSADVKKDFLKDLTKGGSRGIFKAPRLSPKYVVDPDFGVKYLSSSEILEKDYLDVKSINVEQANENDKYKVLNGMTLITSSGTIGRTSFASEEVHGWMGSPHFMRVQPDTNKISEGYLYAFLSSKFGYAQIREGIYGSIIVAIEPEHIGSLLVPRMSDIEAEVDSLIKDSARARHKANETLKEAIKIYEKLNGLPSKTRKTSGYSSSISIASSGSIQKRFDARFHSKDHQNSVAAINQERKSVKVINLSEKIFEPNRFKRIKAESGTKLFGTTAIFQNTPDYNCFLSKKIKNFNQYIVDRKMLLVPRSGQLNGIIGNVEVATGALLKNAVSEDAIRIACKSIEIAGYLYVALSSEYSRSQLKCRAFGTSIPHLDVKNIGDVQVMLKNENVFSSVSSLGCKISNLRNEAYELEMKAVALLEESIESLALKK